MMIDHACASCSRPVPARQAVTTLEGQLCMPCNREQVKAKRQAKNEAWAPVDDVIDVTCPTCRVLPGEHCEDIDPDERVGKFEAHHARMDLWAPPPTAEQVERVADRFAEGTTFADIARERS